ncbi:peptidase M20 domain-containing protein 2-like [Amblyomma americanum]
MMDPRAVADEAVAARAQALHAVGRFLWENPETRFEEHRAHDTLCAFLEAEGFDVQRHNVLQTAFRAEYGAGSPVVAFLCEYDALPGLGHACGHNLIAESALAAAVAARELVRRTSLLSGEQTEGKIVVLGTPAEEGGMGKDLLLRAGALDDVDAALMAHPENRSVLRLGLSARCGVSALFESCDVSEGRPSALDAAVLAYANISLLRARLDPQCRLHGVLLRSETSGNLEVSSSRLDFNVRGPDTERVLGMRHDVEACMKAAAVATGCKVRVAEMAPLCKHMNINEPLLRLFQRHAEDYGIVFDDSRDFRTLATGSTSDVGNVSHRMPTIHPVYRIESVTFNHTAEFCRASGTRQAQECALVVGKALALTAFDLLCDPSHLDKAKEDFERSVKLAQ